MTVLVVAAHPDDEVLGCGGTISKLSRDGHEIHVAILGEGITSRYDRREDAKIALVEELRDSSRQVAQLLGVKEILLHDFPDNRFDTVPLLDIIKLIEKLIDKVRPRIIFTHHGGDLNNDGFNDLHYWGATVGLNYTPLPNITIRPEVRFDWATSHSDMDFNDVFVNNTKDSLELFAVDFTFLF